jgi:hypothetical protein
VSIALGRTASCCPLRIRLGFLLNRCHLTFYDLLLCVGGAG